VVLGVEGLCALFDFGPDNSRSPLSPNSIAPAFTQQLTVNTSAAILFDVDGDGFQVTVPAQHNMVFVLIFQTNRPGLTRNLLLGGLTAPWLLFAGTVWCGFFICYFPLCLHVLVSFFAAGTDGDEANSSAAGFVEVGRWSCPGMIGGLSVVNDPGTGPVLCISQPGSTFMTMAPGQAPAHTSFSSAPFSSRQQGSLTEILGNVFFTSAPALVALCTHAGTLELCSMRESVWQLQADHQFFALAQLDSALAACAFDAFAVLGFFSSFTLTYMHAPVFSLLVAGLMGLRILWTARCT
jgi:hypothetical protein